MYSNIGQILTDAQLKSEIKRCNYCENKPCKDACPSNCSPADFIMAIQNGEPQDFKRAAAMILSKNPLGGICGAVCPDSFCMKACTHTGFDIPLNIPAIQATIIQRAKDLNKTPQFFNPKNNSIKIAIVGAGPSGIASAAVLAQEGYQITIFEDNNRPGGMCNLIPDSRLDKSILQTDIDFLLNLGTIKYENKDIEHPEDLLNHGFQSVIIGTGLNKVVKLQIPGNELAIDWNDFLEDPEQFELDGKNIAIIGGGAVALDCAIIAKIQNANSVDFICLENPGEMNLDQKERELFYEEGFGIVARTKVKEIMKDSKLSLAVKNVKLVSNKKFSPENVIVVPGTERILRDYDYVIFAIGAKSSMDIINQPGIFCAGDVVNGPTTVVEAVASGKNTAANVIEFLHGKELTHFDNPQKSNVKIFGEIKTPVNLQSYFFDRKIISPFILSAAPPTDGYEQMKKAYEAGWAGGIIKTAFDNLPIHIPAEYMYKLGENTFGNADNVSSHPLDRVCDEIKKLIFEYPDRLTLASTGGPVTGDDNEDKLRWQSNTKKLEDAGVMGIEYSLSCPQGGDGTKGDIVSQDPELTAKIVTWIMEISNPKIPKLFKLTGAVTAIYPVLAAIKEVLSQFAGKQAGVTLANTFPGLAFQNSNKKNWDDGVVVGMSGQGIVNISNLTLANASKIDMSISGNGGPMNYKEAAHFLALGAETVQFCTIAMKYGYGIIDELHSGLSYLLEEKEMASVDELIGAALPNPIKGFMELSSEKKISSVEEDLCVSCGNCTRCPYMAISLNENLKPETDPSKCIGCSFCTLNCFSGALLMRIRTTEEANLLIE